MAMKSKKLRHLDASEDGRLTRDGETISYPNVTLGKPRPPSPREIEYGQRLAAELKEGISEVASFRPGMNARATKAAPGKPASKKSA